MAAKAKNMCQRHTYFPGGWEGGSGVSDMARSCCEI